jgi:hypothetical protein
LEFTYEIMSENNINVRFNYGGEWFTFDLFQDDRQWVLHPFDSALIRNKDMSRLVIADLLQHKPFQVMLAKEGIILSELTVSISLERRLQEPEYEELVRSDRRLDSGPDDRLITGWGDELADADIDRLIEQNDLDDLIAIEIRLLEQRQRIYNQILHKMFMADLGPGDAEFQRVQQMVRAYGEAKSKLEQMRQ